MAWFFFAGIALLMCALTATLQRDGPGDGPTIAAAATEKRVSLSDLRLVLRSRYAWHLGLIYLLYGFAYIIYLTFFQKRLISDLGLSPNSAGDLFLLAGVSSIILGTLGGTISDRFGRGRALALVLALQAVAACLFGLRLGAAALVVSAVLFGAGVFTVAGLVGAACGDKFGTRLAFPSLGFVTVFIGLGQALGPYLGGSLADRFASLGPAYLMCAAVSAAAAVAALFLPDFRR